MVYWITEIIRRYYCFRKFSINTLEDNSIIYADVKIPEALHQFIKKSLPVEAKFSGNKIKFILEL